MGKLQTIARRVAPALFEERAIVPGGLYAPGTTFSFGGVQYAVGGNTQAYITQLAQDAYATSGPVGAVMAVRLHVYSEITFRWQRQAVDGRYGGLFGSNELSILETPWPGASTPDLLHVMEVDGSIAGNCYLVRERQAFLNGEQLTRLDPSKVTVVTGDVKEPVYGQEYGRYLVGYAYRERPGDDPIPFNPGELVHYRPLPSHKAPQFFGRSWMDPILPDSSADAQLTQFKQSFLANGASPSMVVSFDPSINVEQFRDFVAKVETSHVGPWNAGKVLYLGGGADPKTIGMTFADLALHQVQGAGETRIAAAAGVPATIVGFSEGLQGSTLNAGNYISARRRFGDGTLRPLWRKTCTALSQVLQQPGANGGTRVRLWYDDRDVAFLQEDVTDSANIREANARTLQVLLNSGYKPDAAVAFVNSDDVNQLQGQHTGWYSVQLQQPPSTTPVPSPSAPSAPVPATNGAGARR